MSQMQEYVTLFMTISDRIKKIRTDLGLTQEEFAASIGLKRPNLANIEIGKQLPTIETLQAIVRKYHKPYSWLIEGVESDKKYAHLNAHPNAHLIAEDHGDSYIKKVGIIEHVIDTSGHLQIPIVDVKAAAGPGYINSEHLSADDVIRLPAHLVKSGHHLCIRIKGTSMAPTLQDGGYAIIRLLDRSEWLHMPNDRIYLVVDNDGKTAIKRVKNRFSGEKGFIVLSSDSPDKSSHPTYNLHPEEIAFIWYVEWYFTAKMPNVHDQYYNRVSQLQDSVDQLYEEVRTIKKRLK